MSESIKVRKIGKYILQELLGEGSMGSVWLSYHTGLNIPVAVKLLDMDLAKDDPDFLNRFMQEGRLAGQLNHKNIVRIYDAGMEANSAYIVMEFIEGCDTLELLEDRGVISPDEVLGLAIAIAEALQEAHSLGIIHRDIKPDNILATTEGRIKLADLGLAKQVDEKLSDTKAGTALGTPYYIAPEQALDAIKADERSDIYSFGATLYHLLSGYLPYEGDNIMSVMLKHTNEPLTPPQEKRPGLPESFCRVICKMMAKNPDDRYQNCTELLEDFNKLKYGNENVAMTEEDLINQSERNLNRNLASGKSVRVRIKPKLSGKYARKKNLDAAVKKKSGSGSRSKPHHKRSRKSKKNSNSKIALIAVILSVSVLFLALLPSILKKDEADKLPADKQEEAVSGNTQNVNGSGTSTSVKVENIEPVNSEVENIEPVNSETVNLLEDNGRKYFEEPSKYFTFKNNRLFIDDLGEPYADEIRTKDIYKNFILTAEYRFLKANSDSGIHFHIQGDKYFEVQLAMTKTPPSGALMARGGYFFIKGGKRSYLHSANVSNSEVPMGEWSRIVFKSKDGILKVTINGLEPYKVRGLSVTSGFISITRWTKCLMEYRKLQIQRLD